MHIDKATLIDLEIFTDQGFPGPLLVKLDKTTTRGGREVLYDLFRHPLANAEAIQARQALFQGLSLYHSRLSLRSLDSTIQRVIRYLDSPFVPLPKSWLRRLIAKFRDRDMVNELAEGLHAVCDLLYDAQTVSDTLEHIDGDITETHHLTATIRDVINDDIYQRLQALLRRDSNSLIRLSRFDALLRADRQEVERLRNLISAMHHVDALQSMATIVDHQGWTFPKIKSDTLPVFEATGIWHPLLKQPIRNHLQLSDPGQLLFLTGPNMAGKTTFLKASALVVYFGHLGLPVPSDSATISVFDRLFVSTTVRDSVSRGESFFVAEVRRIKTLISYLTNGETVFAVVDEMFKGTNTLDAHDATKAVIEGLAGGTTGLSLVSSHHAELAQELGKVSHISFSYFEGVPSEAGLQFSYVLQPGYSTQRLGMLILDWEGVLEMVKNVKQRSQRLR